ncbi:MAG: ATP-binding protein [Ruminococcus sp.]|nr:ATP-binding protein [Ruminococcus sp.]
MKLAGSSILTLQALGIAGYFLNILFLAGMMRGRVAGRNRSGAIFIPPLVICLLLLMSITEVCRYVTSDSVPSEFEKFAEKLSAPLCIGIEFVMTIVWGVLWLRQELNIIGRLTPQSLEDGLNSMPDGVAFVSSKGVPLLVNSTMQRLFRESMGSPYFDIRDFEYSMQNQTLIVGCSADIHGKGYYLHLSDGSVWDIQKSLMMIDGRKVWELLAYDVTERYRKSLELEERNVHLEEVNRSIRNYTREMNAIIREEEVLAAKIRIHDDVGRALLALKSYLIRGGDREDLIEMWQFTAGLLSGENTPDDSADPIGALKEAADAVGVKLILNGDIPRKLRKLIAIAIHECLTNTVKHADGSELTVDITDEDGIVTVVFTNDGKPPEGEISESGGLKSLRSTVEQFRGEMEIASEPRFMLTIRVSGKE